MPQSIGFFTKSSAVTSICPKALSDLFILVLFSNVIPEDSKVNSKDIENFIIFEDGTPALIKKPLSAVPNFSGVYPSGKLKIQQDEYNPLLSKEIANIAGIPCAEYYLAYENKANYILTPSFLKDGDELILGEALTDKEELDMDMNNNNI